MEVLVHEELRESEPLGELMARLSRQPDFAALQTSIRRVQSLAGNETARLQALVEAIVDDPALTTRLIRVINAAHYRGLGAGQISSVQRAVAVMGFNAVRNLAVTLKLLDRVAKDRRSRLLREDFLRSLLAARLANELAWDDAHPEELYVVALFQSLGRMLMAAHLPDEALAVRDAVPRAGSPLCELEEKTSLAKLGVSFSDIGREVARVWGWPESMRATMKFQPWPHLLVEGRVERMRLIGRLANDLADLMLYARPDDWPQQCDAVESYAGRPTGLRAREMMRALAQVRRDLESLAELVGLPLDQLKDWHRSDVVDGLPEPVRTQSGEASAGSGLAHMAAQTHLISTCLATEEDCRHVPQWTVDAASSGLGARRGVLFMARGASSVLSVVHTVGTPLAEDRAGSQPWTIDPIQGQDLFAKLLARGADTWIGDASRPEIQRLLPEAFACAGKTTSFVILPMLLRKKPVGLIYLDRGDGLSFDLSEERMRLLATLRNQALMALR